MSRSPRVLVVLVGVAAFAAPASAQAKPTRPVTRPGHDVVVRMAVTDWFPRVGAPGTLITIEGRAFARGCTVLVGGRPVSASIGSSRISFRIPAVHGDGEVRLRKPNVADDLVLGKLVVDVPADIRTVSPAAGAAGTKVEILGHGFAPGDEVRMNGRAIPIAESSAERLVVTVPEWARTDYLALSRTGSERTRSRRPFRVLAAPPLIAGFSPASGPPGTRVRISGTNFGPKDRIRFGVRALSPAGRGNGWVDVNVPLAISQTQRFRITGDGGEAISPDEFRLEIPVVITDVRPLVGVPGSQFWLTGRGFQAGDKVVLGSKRADLVQVRPGEIVALVPYGTPGGAVAVRRDEVETVARKRFTVVNAPLLTGFLPTRGEPGTRVTLTGTWLAGAQVWFGDGRVRPTRIDDKSIEVVIPPGSSDQRFRIKTPAGEATTDRAFQVVSYGVISDARPRRVVAGAELRLFGEELDHIDKIYLGPLELSVVARDGRTATVVVPPGAADGKLGWSSHGRRAETTWDVKILQPPSIAGFQPDAGPPRTQLIVRGRAFDGATRLFLGERPLRIVRRGGDHELVAEIPAGARGRDYLWVQGDGARVRSTSQFAVLVAPQIEDVTPRRAAAGDTLTVRGVGFDGSTDILVGPWRTTVLKRGDGVVEVQVPPIAAAGNHPVVARRGPLTSTFTGRLTVEAARPTPTVAITGFSPRRVGHGGTIEIHGTGLGPRSRILIGAIELPVTKVDPSGTRLWVIVPDTVGGEQPLDVVDGSRRSRSVDRVTIVGGAAAGPSYGQGRGPSKAGAGDGQAGGKGGQGKVVPR